MDPALQQGLGAGYLLCCNYDGSDILLVDFVRNEQQRFSLDGYGLGIGRGRIRSVAGLRHDRFALAADLHVIVGEIDSSRKIRLRTVKTEISALYLAHGPDDDELLVWGFNRSDATSLNRGMGLYSLNTQTGKSSLLLTSNDLAISLAASASGRTIEVSYIDREGNDYCNFYDYGSKKVLRTVHGPRRAFFIGKSERLVYADGVKCLSTKSDDCLDAKELASKVDTSKDPSEVLDNGAYIFQVPSSTYFEVSPEHEVIYPSDSKKAPTPLTIKVAHNVGDALWNWKNGEPITLVVSFQSNDIPLVTYNNYRGDAVYSFTKP